MTAQNDMTTLDLSRESSGFSGGGFFRAFVDAAIGVGESA